MFNVAEYKRKTNRMTDLLPWAALVASGIVLNKDGSFQRTMHFRGPDLESSTAPQLVTATAQLNNALKRLGSGWALFIEARRQQAQGYPEVGAFPDPISWMLDAERRDDFEQGKDYFESYYYLTFQYLPERESVSKLSNLFMQNAHNDQRADYHKALTLFQSSTDRVFDILSDFMYQTAWLNDDETLTYLHACISDQLHTVKTPDIPMYLDGVLADTHLVGGLAPQLGRYHLQTISVLGFPSSAVPAILDQLNHLPIEYRWMTRFLPLDKLDAEKALKGYRRQWFSKRKGMMSLLMETFSKSESQLVDSVAMRKSQDADAALQELGDDYVSFGYYTATITVWDEDLNVVKDKAREVERVINGLGFTTILETVNAVDAWLSSLPGNPRANVRMPLLSSLNLAQLIPFSAIWAGPEKDPHMNGPVMIYAKTTGDTPFRFSNHIGDVGHEMIIGPTGAGKSVLLNVMGVQFLRYPDAQVFIFDKGGSYYLSTRAVGGEYYDVGNQTAGGLVFQPLANVDQEDERTWAADWVCGVLQNENITINPAVKEDIWRALTNLASMPVQQRTLTGLKALVQDTAVRSALDAYTLGGPYGHVLDASQEHFSDKNWQCFEMERLMQMPAIISPVLSYIFHVLERRFDGKPTLLLLDEAWLYLDNPMFENKIREWLKTLRKLNVSVIFATQSVDDTINAKIAPTLIESCPSRIFLPNDRALEPNVEQAYLKLGLNDRQINILATAMPKRQYYFESSDGNALFDLALGPLALAVCAVSQAGLIKKLKQLWDECGQDTDQFMQTYLHQQGLDWAVDLLKELLQLSEFEQRPSRLNLPKSKKTDSKNLKNEEASQAKNIKGTYNFGGKGPLL